MRHEHERHRPRTAEQFDLFGAPGGRSTGRTPAWEALPAHARAELTALMTRLILEHARSRGATTIEAARHER
jgi:hypothetical protein